ncbi:unnamed protein product [Durusdinium trenchii]|uniref:Uncharacterized protein n=1 Tax=Durusdinium trenchii TaxID=1381693 RepID=A0ABP0K449_9DINO
MITKLSRVYHHIQLPHLSTTIGNCEVKCHFFILLDTPVNGGTDPKMPSEHFIDSQGFSAELQVGDFSDMAFTEGDEVTGKAKKLRKLHVGGWKDDERHGRDTCFSHFFCDWTEVSSRRWSNHNHAEIPSAEVGQRDVDGTGRPGGSRMVRSLYYPRSRRRRKRNIDMCFINFVDHPSEVLAGEHLAKELESSWVAVRQAGVQGFLPNIAYCTTSPRAVAMPYFNRLLRKSLTLESNCASQKRSIPNWSQRGRFRLRRRVRSP